jgi:hypothetical protein
VTTTTIREGGLSVETIDLDVTPENVDLAGPASPDAWRFVRSVLDRAAEIHDDLALDLLVRTRDEHGPGRRVPLERLLEARGFDVPGLERELDAEGE